MADSVVFQSAEPWDAERPQTLVISCVDGRWRPYIQEFLTEYVGISPHTDFMAVPGGVEPLTLVDLIPKDFSFFRRRIEALVAGHGTRRVMCIAHQDCSWYAERKIGPITDRSPGAAAARPATRGGVDARDVPEHPGRDVLRAPARRRRRT